VARRPRDARIETRDARARLKPKKEPYWRQIHRGLAVGYYKGARGGSWTIRRTVGKKKFHQRIGLADDYADADGVVVLSYEDTVKRAMRGDDSAPATPRGKRTVGDACEAYIADRKAHGAKSAGEIERVLRADILPTWRNVLLTDATRSRINRWIADLVSAPRRMKGGKTLPADNSKEAKRRRRSTAKKKWSNLRAALNFAYDNDMTDVPVWKGVKDPKNVDPAPDIFPTLDECKRLARRAPADFRPIVEATYQTGAAYGELIAMKVKDYRADSGHVNVFDSKRRNRSIPLTAGGVALFDEITAGRGGDEPMFVRADGRAWKKSEQQRPMAEANALAKISPAITLTKLRKTYGSLLLNSGVSLDVVSTAMGHSDTRITRKHYARFLQGTIDEAIRKALPSLGRRPRKVSRLK
jgi:integrase